MNLPLTIDKYYTTHLSKKQLIEELNNLITEKKFGGLRSDKFVTNISESGFVIGRKTYGVDGFTFERYPVIEGIYFSENPVTINILIRPSYFTILFFSIFAIVFILGGIFMDEITVNGVLRVPTIIDRLLFAGFGGIVPGLWCYFGYIRPIKKAERWIVGKLMLRNSDNNMC